MPTFIDWHHADQIPAELRSEIQGRIRSKKPDADGVIDRGVVLDREANKMYCILDAPNEEAVRKHHKHAGIEVEEIHKAETLL